MKNIFKKNQIIITALAIMIVIAGYLSFTNNDTPDDAKTVETANPDSEDYDVFTELEGTDVVTDTTTDDTTGTDTTTDDTDGTDTTTDDTDGTDTTADDTDETDTTADDTDVETTADENEEEEDAADELGDISDEDLLQTAQNVTDKGELEIEDGVPGEAVLASAALDASFFISTKIEREQLRARNEETYMDVIDNAEATDDMKKDAIAGMLELTVIAKKENIAEKLLEAKGFDGAFVSIVKDKADVVVNASNLSDQQLAIIEDVVKRKTEIAAEHITIIPVIVSE